MDSTRYVQIPCPVCGGKNLAVGGQPRPTECVHCQAPLDGRPPARAVSSGARPSDPATRTVATFERGTFTHTPRPSSANRPPASARKPARDAELTPGGFVDRLMRLIAHRG